MTIITHRSTASTSRPRTNASLFALEGELENIDRDAGHDYLPMDVFIDPETIKEHFQESSIRSRLTGSLCGTA